MTKLNKALRHPGLALRFASAIVNGHLYKAWYGLFRTNVSIGRNFRVTKRLRIKGPGTIVIGDSVTIDGTSHAVTPYTYAKEAIIRIGNNVFLNSTRFGCRISITVGDDCILGDANVTDTDFHHVDPRQRHSPEPPPAKPVVIERNVWIAGASIVLKGVTIGENSVVGAGSVVTRDIPKDSLALGNPAQVVKSI